MQTCDDFRMDEGCKLHGFGVRTTEEPRGMFALRARADLSANQQRDLRAALAEAGIAAPFSDETEPAPARLAAGQWLPPESEGPQRRAFEAIAVRFDIGDAWFFQVGSELPRA